MGLVSRKGFVFPTDLTRGSLYAGIHHVEQVTRQDLMEMVVKGASSPMPNPPDKGFIR